VVLDNEGIREKMIAQCQYPLNCFLLAADGCAHPPLPFRLNVIQEDICLANTAPPSPRGASIITSYGSRKKRIRRIISGSNVSTYSGRDKKWRSAMAVNVHAGGGTVLKILLYVAAFTGFVIVALTWVPDMISPESANITGNTGSTARMIQ